MRSASATAAAPGATPQRCAPTSISTSASSVTPAVFAAAPRWPIAAASSTSTPIVASRASAARRASLPAPTISLVTSTSRIPAATKASASPTFWQQTPAAPRSICSSAIAGHLCDLACGRSAMPEPWVAFAIRSRLRSNASRSTTSAGVSTSPTASPTRAGSLCMATIVPRKGGVRRGAAGMTLRLFRIRGFERGELPVDDLGDGKQLRAIEPARDRVAAVVVDPVEDADAVLDGVAEGGLAAAPGRPAGGRLPPHLQRQPLLVGVLVHEERRRVLVARDQAAADEGVTKAVEVGGMDLEAEPLREPGDEALLLVRPDLDRAPRVGRVQRVRERRLARERRRRARPLDQRVAAEPPDRDADDEARRRRERGGDPAPHERAGPGRRRGSDERVGHRLRKQRIERVAQRGALRADAADARRELRIRREDGLDLVHALGRELAVRVRVEVGVGEGVPGGAHDGVRGLT